MISNIFAISLPCLPVAKILKFLKVGALTFLQHRLYGVQLGGDLEKHVVHLENLKFRIRDPELKYSLSYTFREI